MNNNNIVVKDIKEIVFGDITISKNKTYEVFNEKIKGKDLINTIISETLDINTEVINGQSYSKVKTSGNKEYSLGLYWTKNTDKIIKEIKRLEEVSYFKNYDYDKIDFTGMYINPTNKLKELIKDTMNNIDEYKYDDNDFLLEVATYQNHKYETFYVMPNINKELDKYVMDERNEKAIKFLEDREVEFSANEEFPLFNYVLSENITKFISYLKNNNKEITNNAFYIYAYDYYGMQILIGNKETFKEEFKKYEENLASDTYYQRLLESYNSDEETWDLEEDYEY